MYILIMFKIFLISLLKQSQFFFSMPSIRDIKIIIIYKFVSTEIKMLSSNSPITLRIFNFFMIKYYLRYIYHVCIKGLYK